MKKIVCLFLLVVVIASCDNSLKIEEPEINPPISDTPIGNIEIKFGKSASSLNFKDKECEKLANFYTILAFNSEKIFTKNWDKNSISNSVTMQLPVGRWKFIILAGIISEQNENNIALIGVSELNKKGFQIECKPEPTRIIVKMSKLNNYIEKPEIFCGEKFTLNISYGLLLTKNKNDKFLFPESIQIQKYNKDDGASQFELAATFFEQKAIYSKTLTSPKFVKEETFEIVNSSFLRFKFSDDIQYNFNNNFCGKNWFIPSDNCHTKAIKDETFYILNYKLKEGNGDIIIIW